LHPNRPGATQSAPWRRKKKTGGPRYFTAVTPEIAKSPRAGKSPPHFVQDPPPQVGVPLVHRVAVNQKQPASRRGEFDFLLTQVSGPVLPPCVFLT
jgi:hypothetical protein